MTNKTESWRCPRCPQTCGRHWNFMIHIDRKHPDLSPGTNQQYYSLSQDQEARYGDVGISQNEVGGIAYLANPTNPNLMRWALLQNRLVQPASTEKWMTIFESNEDRYMTCTVMMLRDMKKYFGEGPGESSFNFFVNLVKSYGSKNAAQLFKNPYFDIFQLQRHSGYQEPKLQEYAKGGYDFTQPTLAPAMMQHDPIAEPFVRRYEEDKLEERKMKREEQQKAAIREAFKDLNTAINLNQIQNPNKVDVAANSLIQISSLVSAGVLVPVPFIDPYGNIAIRYEPRNLVMPQTQLQNGNGNGNGGGGISTADILRIIETCDKRNEILIKYIEAIERKNYIKDLELAKILAESGNLHQTTKSIGAQRSKPEERNLEVDANVARIEKKELEEVEEKEKEVKDESKYMIKQKMNRRDEIETKQQGVKVFGSMNDMTYQLPTFYAFFKGQDGELHMPKSVWKLFVRLMGNNKQPQQTKPKPQRQYVQYQTFETQQVIDYHELMKQDQQLVDKTQKMLEAHIRERDRIATSGKDCKN